MPSPVAFSTVKPETVTYEAVIFTPLSCAVASMVAPWPLSVSAFATATLSW
jgi:hypothetical protein